MKRTVISILTVLAILTGCTSQGADNPVNIIGHYDVDNGVVFYRQTDGKCVMFDVNAVIEEKYRPFTALEVVKENNILYVWDGEKYQPMKS